MIGEQRAPSISSGPVIVSDNPAEKTLDVLVFSECTTQSRLNAHRHGLLFSQHAVFTKF